MSKEEISELVYQLAKKAYEEPKQKDYVANEIASAWGISKVYAFYIISNYKKIIEGQGYERKMRLEASKAFLRGIQADNSEKVFHNSLNAVLMHIRYYNGLGKDKQKKLAELVEKLKLEFNIELQDPQEVLSDEVEEFFEGGIKSVTLNQYERDKKARAKCLATHGFDCKVCGLNFEKIYGAIGKGFIHVHHIVDIAMREKPYKLDPIRDLAPVCPNCHAMLHSSKPAMSIEELKMEMKKG